MGEGRGEVGEKRGRKRREGKGTEGVKKNLPFRAESLA